MPNYKKKKYYRTSIKLGTTDASYVFASNGDFTGSMLTDLGLTEVTDDSTIGAAPFVNANCPKPPRATVSTATGKKSSFCNPVVAVSKGIQSVGGQTSRKIHTEAGSSKVVSVFVVIGGINRAWNMHKTQYDLIKGDFTQLGIALCKQSDASKYVWGCSAPYPARVQRFNASGTEGGDTFTTFCSAAKEDSLTTWAIIENSQSVGQFLGLSAAPVTP